MHFIVYKPVDDNVTQNQQYSIKNQFIMNSKQQSKYNMYLTSDEFLTTNSSTTALLPKFSGFYSTFQNGILQIRSSNEQQSLNKSGVASNKSQLRKLLIILAADTLRKSRAYATVENNQILLSELKLTESDLKNATDSELDVYSQSIYDKGQAHILDLTPYGITEQTQTALLKAITDFKAVISTPRNSTIDTKLSTEQIVKTFTTCDKALDNIDALVEVVRISQPDFYSGYKSARKIIDTSARSLQVKGIITDSNTGEGLKGATLSFTQNSNSTGLTKAAASSNVEVVKKKDSK